jgi:hypothetical protein
MYALDVTGERWMLVDVDEAHVRFFPPRTATGSLEVEYRDLVLHLDTDPSTASALGLAADVRLCQLPMWSRIAFAGVVAMEFWAALYKDELGSALRMGRDGEEIKLERQWGNKGSAHEYNGGGRLDWPPANCGLDIWAHGPATLTVVASSCVPRSGSRA